MPVEDWRPVVGYEDIYAVSESGRVMRITSAATRGAVPGRVLRPRIKTRGYLHYALVREAKREDWTAHRLVAFAFLGEPKPGQIVRHLDGVPSNNHYSNLSWGSPKENYADGVRHGTLGKKDVCSKGHEMVGDNVRVNSSTGQRSCRACRQRRDRERYYRKTAIAAVTEGESE